MNLLRTYPALAGMLGVSFLLALAQQGPNNVFVLYAKHRYDWGPPNIGLMMTVFGATGMIVQAGLVPLATKFLGERKALLIGSAFQVVGLIGFAIATTGTMFWAAVPIMCLGGIGGPAWSSMVSRSVGPSEQGRLAGASNSLNSLSAIIGPTLFTLSFAVAIAKGAPAWLPVGAPFFMAAFFMALAAGGAAWVTRPSRAQAWTEKAEPPIMSS